MPATLSNYNNKLILKVVQSAAQQRCADLITTNVGKVSDYLSLSVLMGLQRSFKQCKVNFCMSLKLKDSAETGTNQRNTSQSLLLRQRREGGSEVILRVEKFITPVKGIEPRVKPSLVTLPLKLRGILEEVNSKVGVHQLSTCVFKISYFLFLTIHCSFRPFSTGKNIVKCSGVRDL